MKATIERSTLLKCLGHVQSVVERRNTIPILSNVLIEATGDGTLRLTATDLDLQIVEHIQGQVQTEGATTVSAHMLFDIVRKLPEGSQVRIEAADGKMLIRAGSAQFDLQTLPRGDFPVLAEGALPSGFDLPAATLAQIIDKTRFAMSTDDMRYFLNGIFLHVPVGSASVLHAVATDVQRLSRVTIPCPEGAQGMPDIILPRKCVAELRKLLDDMDGSVRVDLSPSKIRFDLGNAVLTSRLIDGTYPDYSRAIPVGNDKLLRINPRSLEEGVDRVATIASEKTRSVKMAIDGDKVMLSVNSPQNGTAAEELPGDYDSDPFATAFNARFLLDILAQVDGDVVEMHLAPAPKPILIRAGGASPALFVLAPLRV